MISIIGKIHTVDNTDTENPVFIEIDGYHVNSTELVAGLEDFLVEPNSPKQTFFGVPTYFYKFPSEEIFIINSPKDEVDENA